MSRIPLNPLGSNSLGDYLREQRQTARLSLRQLSELAGVSNPYLSQIERGLKRPSAEILQQLAKGLEVSAESLYVRAGILDERHHGGAGTVRDPGGHLGRRPALRAAEGRTARHLRLVRRRLHGLDRLDSRGERHGWSRDDHHSGRDGQAAPTGQGDPQPRPQDARRRPEGTQNHCRQDHHPQDHHSQQIRSPP